MRYSQPEKMEVIKVVEQSALSVKRPLKELGINRSTFYQNPGQNRTVSPLD